MQMIVNSPLLKKNKFSLVMQFLSIAIVDFLIDN